MIYLDYNATTPCDPAVLEAMWPYFTDKFGNAASRTHPYGWIADEAVRTARRQVAALIGAEDSEVIFTSGATESCNLAIKGVYESYASKGNHIITCTTEHKAVLDTCAHLERKGAQVTYLPVDTGGRIDLTALEQSITAQTILIAIMWANNETGLLHPVAEIAEIAQRHNVVFFTDATQAVGKVPVNVAEHPVGMLALSAHKIYSPKGAGALFIRRKGPRVRPAAQMDGGGHENGFRSGTLNVPGIVGLGAACNICRETMTTQAVTAGKLRDMLETGLAAIAPIHINGDKQERLSHVSNVSFTGYRAERLISLTNTGLAFSVGSACTSASQQASHVLQAMGLSEHIINGSVRFSLGRYTTEPEIRHTIELIDRALRSL